MTADFDSWRPWFEAELEGALAPVSAPAGFSAAFRYAVLGGGKRIRPEMFFSCLNDLGIPLPDGKWVGIALELIHCASLVHDDLPALDNDDFRRGQPSCHKRFGDGPALLFGDWLPMHAAVLIAQGGGAAELKLALVSTLAQAYREVCSGQLLDLSAEERERDLLGVYLRKTGALFGASLESAALIAGMSDEQRNALRLLGERVGVGFQILDDYLDLFGNDAERGRSGSSDTRNQRFNFFTKQSRKEGLQQLNEYLNEIERDLRLIEVAGLPAGRRSLSRTRAAIARICSRVEQAVRIDAPVA